MEGVDGCKTDSDGANQAQTVCPLLRGGAQKVFEGVTAGGG